MKISQASKENNFGTNLSVETAFRRAGKHSIRVKRMKILLPVIAIFITLALIAATFLHTLAPNNFSLDTASIENGMIVMTNPGMSGRNNDGIAYSLKATRALLPASNPDDSQILLENVIAKVPVDDEVTAVVNATRTYYDRLTEHLQIDDPFTIKLSNGMTAKFQSAKIDIKAGTLNSDDPVAINAPQTSVVAHNVNITNNGKRIVFGGGVHVTLHPSALRQTGQ